MRRQEEITERERERNKEGEENERGKEDVEEQGERARVSQKK